MEQNNIQKRKIKYIVIIILVFVIVAIIGVLGYYFINIKSEQSELENEYNELQKIIDDNSIQLSKDNSDMLEEINKNIKSFNVNVLDEAEDQIDDMEEILEELKDCSDDWAKMNEHIKELNAKSESINADRYCNEIKEKCVTYLTDSNKALEENNVSKFEEIKKDYNKSAEEYANIIESIENKNSDDSGSIRVTYEGGDKNATTNVEINIRDIDFSKSKKDINDYEKMQEDTVDKPIVSSSSDGYSYHMYWYEDQGDISLFGINVDTSIKNNPYQVAYVFYYDKLIELRLGLGSLSSDEYDTLIDNMSENYGEPTYFVIYSNGSIRNYWKTNTCELQIIKESENVAVYLRKNEN